MRIILIKDALEELPLSAKLTTDWNGERLMQLLTVAEHRPTFSGTGHRRLCAFAGTLLP